MSEDAKIMGRLVEKLTGLQRRVREPEGIEVEQRQADASLQATLQEARDCCGRLEFLLRLVTDGLIVTDGQGRIVLMNPAAERLLGVSAEEVTDRSFAAALENQSDPEGLQAALLSQASESWTALELVGQDPAHPWSILAKTTAIPCRPGRPGGKATLLKDVTREREGARMKTEVLATAAHELRAPLTSVLGFAGLLLNQNGLGKEQQGQFLAYIYQRAEDLSKIIDDLQHFSHMESDRQIFLYLQSCDLGEAVAQLVDQYRWKSSNHQFEVELPTEPVHAVLDRRKIVQVLENLISNAVKYSPRGGRIRISGTKTENGVQISVADEGIGMTREQSVRIFDKFYRADSLSRSIRGMGLGMTISKNIVEAHGGRIWVESAPGEGTSVHFTLPALPAAAGGADRNEATHLAHGGFSEGSLFPSLAVAERPADLLNRPAQ